MRYLSDREAKKLEDQWAFRLSLTLLVFGGLFFFGIVLMGIPPIIAAIPILLMGPRLLRHTGERPKMSVFGKTIPIDEARIRRGCWGIAIRLAGLLVMAVSGYLFFLKHQPTGAYGFLACAVASFLLSLVPGMIFGRRTIHPPEILRMRGMAIVGSLSRTEVDLPWEGVGHHDLLELDPVVFISRLRELAIDDAYWRQLPIVIPSAPPDEASEYRNTLWRYALGHNEERRPVVEDCTIEFAGPISRDALRSRLQALLKTKFYFVLEGNRHIT